MIHLLIFNNSATLVTSSWDGWWTYDGISGQFFFLSTLCPLFEKLVRWALSP